MKGGYHGTESEDRGGDYKGQNRGRDDGNNGNVDEGHTIGNNEDRGKDSDGGC